MPIIASRNNRAPLMEIHAHHLPQRSREDTGARIRLFHTTNHFLKAVNLTSNALSSWRWAIYAEAQLKVLFIPHQDIGQSRNLMENLA